MLAAAAALLGAPAASADENWTTPADVLGENGDQHIDYPSFHSDSNSAPWMTAAAVGDVNGDGLEDVGAGFDDFNPSTSDPIYITFSTRLGGVIDALAPGGFQISVPDFNSGLSSAGDVNGDGLGDVAIVETGRILVVFGKRGGETVDAADLGKNGFTIESAGATTSSGGNGVMRNQGVTLLGDLNGDGVRDLLVSRGSGAAIVYPPRDAAGTTINAGAPGPYVSRLDDTSAHPLEEAKVDNLGDLDGDGRDDVLVAGEEHDSTDQVAYGVRGPLPGATVDMPAAVAAGGAFELRTHDGQPGWSGELEEAVTLGDENGDGRREVGMVNGVDGLHGLRVAFSPPFGQAVDIADLRATDARGYSFHSYGNALDVGDQNGDGRGDFSSSRYVYFTNPALEDGNREPVYSGFYFSFSEPNFATIGAPMKDLNLDGKPELIVARSNIHDNSSDPNNPQGQNATYSIDVFDSAIVPHIPVPDPPVTLPDGTIEVPVDLGTGAGSRGGASLGLHAGVEVADSAGGTPTVVADGGVMPSGGQTKHLALKVPAGRLVTGREYRVRYVAGNGRGLAATGPWRRFVVGGTGTPAAGSTPPRRACTAAHPRTRRGTGHGDRMTGTRCPDVLLGLGGDDWLSGLGGADTLRGGRGRDVLRGGPGSDALYGGPGADRIYARDGRRDTVHCGSGRDSVRADRIDRLVGCERKLR
jgi:hypothetical protein